MWINFPRNSITEDHCPLLSPLPPRGGLRVGSSFINDHCVCVSLSDHNLGQALANTGLFLNVIFCLQMKMHQSFEVNSIRFTLWVFPLQDCRCFSW